LTVAQDVAGTTTALQDYITKYNQLMKDYKTASTSSRNADGSIAPAPLSNDVATRALMSNLKGTLAGATAGLPGSSTYKTWANLGVTNLSDGSLYLNSYTFQQAMNADPSSVANLIAFSGSSTSPAVSVKGGGPTTATGNVAFAITKDLGTGVVSGTLWDPLTENSLTNPSIPVSNGVLVGTGAYAGLNLSVTGTGSGTLTLSRGAGQAASDLISTFTGTTGGMAALLKSISTQNTGLAAQIVRGQALLDQEKVTLQNQFAVMEAAVGQMKAVQGTLLGS
jgi:flagellar capping protein FliD